MILVQQRHEIDQSIDVILIILQRLSDTLLHCLERSDDADDIRPFVLAVSSLSSNSSSPGVAGVDGVESQCEEVEEPFSERSLYSISV